MFAKVLRVVNAPYRDGAAAIYTWGLTYLGLLWIAAVWDFQAFAVGLMWFVGIALFPIAYLQPASLGVLSTIEWLNRRDPTNRWDTARFGVLLFICIMGAGGLAILLSFIDAGMAFPIVIPMILMIVACMGYAGKVNTERWMVVLAVLATLIAVFSTLKVMPYDKWSRGIYESTGYSVDVAPSKGDVAARKAYEENRRLADVAVGQCIADAKMRYKNKVVNESIIAKENAACQARYAIADDPSAHSEPTPEAILQAERENAALLKSLEVGCINMIKDAKLKRNPPLPLDASDRAKMKECSTKYKQVASSPPHKDGAASSQRGAAGAKKPDGVWGAFMHYWNQFERLRETNFWLWAVILLIAHVPLWYLGKWIWRKLRGETETTKVVTKSSATGTIFGMTAFEWIVGITAIWLVLSIVAGKFITSGAELRGVFEGKMSAVSAEKVTGYPGQFFTADELGHWQARVETPHIHPFFGEMGGPLEMVKLVDSGKRADMVSQFESGRGFIVMVNKLDPKKDIVFNNNVCPAAKIPAGGNRHQTVCTSTGRSGDGSLRFSIEMGWSATERYAVLIQSDGGPAIKLRFAPKYP